MEVKSSLPFREADKKIKQLGFFLVTHPVVLHHLRKEFSDFEVTFSKFYILPVGPDFLHVALVECEHGMGITDDYGTPHRFTMIKYAVAGDDLLYGLRNKFPCGGSENNTVDLKHIEELMKHKDLRDHHRYVRARFRHGRIKAKTRALFIMVKDLWRGFKLF